MPRCRDCDGTGYRVVPVLVTYSGHSFAVKEKRSLAHLQPQDVAAYMEDLRETRSDQTILTEAVPCHCNTGESS